MELSRIIDLTSSLIRFHTTADNPLGLKQCASFLEDFFAKSPLAVNHIEHKRIPSLVLTAKGVSNPEIFLNGHFDVVNGESGQFEPSLMTGRLHGRGTYDMKGAVATMCCLMQDLAAEDRLGRNVGLMLVGDEEVGGACGSKYLLEEGYRPKCVLIGEPTNLEIEYRAKGVLWLKIAARGTSAHSAYPWSGNNAIARLLDVLEKVRAAFAVPKKEAWITTCNIGKISGGDVANKVPDYAEAILDFRYVPEQDPEKLVEKVKTLAGNSALEVLAKEPPVLSSQKDRYVQKLKIAAESVLGREVRFVSGHGASDGRFFAAQGASVVVMGPVGNGQHTSNEWVDVESLKSYYEVLRKFLQSLEENRN